MHLQRQESSCQEMQQSGYQSLGPRFRTENYLLSQSQVFRRTRPW